MSRCRRLVAAALVAAAVTLAGAGPGAAAVGVRSTARPALVEAEQRYGRDPHQVVTLIRPAGDYADRRTVVFIHGGAWTGGSRDTWDTEARDWATHGWVTINMDYRRAAFDGHPGDGPRIAQDVVTVYRKYAPLRLTGRFVLVGDSAGGQLATAVGSQLGKQNVAGVVAWSPVASPRAMAAHVREAGSTREQRLLGRKAQEFWGQNFDGWSAYAYMRTGAAPPMYVVGGTREVYVDWAEQGGSLCTTAGFTGVCAAVASNLHATDLWRTPDGAKQRIEARRWSETLTS